MLIYNALAFLSLVMHKIINDRRIYMVLMYGFLIFVAAARSVAVGSDTETYTVLYEENKYTDICGYTLFDLNNKIEIGVLLIMILSRYIADTPQTFIAMMALFTLLSLAFFVWREAGKYYYLATFIIITFGFYFYMMNAERQALAIAISCHAISYAMRAKYFKSLIVVLLSSMFHFSLVILVPIIILLMIINMEMKKKTRVMLLIFICILSTISLYYGYTYIFNNMDLLESKSYYITSKIYGDTKISGIYFYSMMMFYGMLSFLLNVLPTKEIQTRFNSIIGILLAIAVIFQLAQVKIMYIFYRFVDTFTIYVCVGIPYFFSSFKDSYYKQGMLLAFILFAFCVMNYQLLTHIQEVYPYKLGI